MAWTYEMVEEIARTFPNMREFRNGCRKAYSAAQRHGWLDKVAEYTPRLHRPNNTMNITLAWELAEAHEDDISAFAKVNRSAYECFREHNKLNELGDMLGRKIKNDYTKALCVEVAMGCADIKELAEKHGGVYQHSKRNGYMQTIREFLPTAHRGGFDPTLPATLYYVSVLGGTAYKIGITNRTVEQRFDPKDFKTVEVIKTWDFPIGYDAKEKESFILNEYKWAKYEGDPLLESGNTELFAHDVLQLDLV